MAGSVTPSNQNSLNLPYTYEPQSEFIQAPGGPARATPAELHVEPHLRAPDRPAIAPNLNQQDLNGVAERAAAVGLDKLAEIHNKPEGVEQSEASLGDRSVEQLSEDNPILPFSYCAVCDKAFNGDMQLGQHLEGKVHKQKADRIAANPSGAGAGAPTPNAHEARFPFADQFSHPFDPQYYAEIRRLAERQNGAAAGAAAPSAEPSAAEAAAQNDVKQILPLTTDAQAVRLRMEYRRHVSPSAQAALSSFSEFDQMQIVKEVDLWNRQTPTEKKGRPINLSARVVHVCKLHHAWLHNQNGAAHAADPNQFLPQAAHAAAASAQAENGAAAGAAAPSAEPSAAEAAEQNDVKQILPLTTDAQAVRLRMEYLRHVSQSAQAALSSFSEFDQLQIVKEIDLWNRQYPTERDGRPINLSARVIHVCKLRRHLLPNQNGAAHAAGPN